MSPAQQTQVLDALKVDQLFMMNNHHALQVCIKPLEGEVVKVEENFLGIEYTSDKE